MRLLVVVGERRAGRKQGPDQRLRFVLGHRLERNRRPAVAAGPLEQRSQERLRRRLFAAEAQQRQHAGAPGGRSSSSSSTALSASAHCRSSIQMTSGRRSAIRPSSSRKRVECPPPETRADRRSPSVPVPAHGRDGVHLQQHREHARQRRHIGRQQALDVLAVESTRDGGSDRRPRRRAPCTARTRSRSSGRRARRHRRARRSGRESAAPARSCRCLTGRETDTAAAFPFVTARKAAFNA